MKLNEIANDNIVVFSTRNPDNDHLIEVEVEVTNYQYDPGMSNPHAAASDVDYYGGEEIDFDILSIFDEEEDREIHKNELSHQALRSIEKQAENKISEQARKNRRPENREW